MKRAAHYARRRRNIRRWSFVAAFGATAVVSVMGWAADGGIGSYFNKKKSQPAPLKQPTDLTGEKAVSGPIRSASRLRSFVQPTKKPLATEASNDGPPVRTASRGAKVIKAQAVSETSERTESSSATSRRSATSNVVRLTKTAHPPHVRPEKLNIDQARPLRIKKQNAFLKAEAGNRYVEPRALTGSSAKPLDSESTEAPAPVLTADEVKSKSHSTTKAAPVRKGPLTIRMPDESVAKRSTTESTSRPQLTTRLVTPESKRPVAAPTRFAEPNSNRKRSGGSFSLARMRQASTPQATDTVPALESPQQSRPAGALESRLRERRLENERAERIRIARAQQNAQDDGQVALNPNSPFEIINEAGNMNVEVGRSRLLKCKVGVFRTAIVDPSIVEAVQFTPTEVSLIGKKAGATQVTFWFENDRETPQTYLIEVEPSSKARDNIQRQYSHLEDVLTDIFPDSKIRLRLVADKLIVRGQAKDSAEAAQIMSIIRAQAGGQGGGASGGFGSLGGGMAAQVGFQDEVGPQAQNNLRVINLLQIPGVQQVALRVKIAELNRSAARGAGIDIDANIEINGNEGALLLQSMLNAQAGNAPALIGQIDNDQIEIGLRWLQQHGVVRVVSEPTLVTLSGTAATFVAGGEFAVPTVVGTGGLSAVTTDFRAFGAIISFMPTVVDKDRIRLQVAPEFSQIDQDLNVGGTPGLQVRAVTSTVEMREGQTLAIAGLLDESFESTRSANLPWVERIINTRDTTRNETELIILVTPELVHPMDPEEVPPLPGFDVSEPTDHEFYYHSRLEGHPARNHRSTIWPRLRRRYGAGGSSMISGPFGHGQ